MKYKLNGQWYDISLPAFDSLPIGTQVDFTGSDIPTGWEQVNDYSTSEVDTGKRWIDGKKIYKKTLHLTNIQRGYRNHEHGISNFGVLVNVYGIVYITDGYNPISRVVPDNITGAGFGVLNIGTQYLYTLAGTSFPTTNDAYITLEYTKSS